MSEIVDFVKSYWFEFASLFFQFAILLTLISLARYASRALRSIRVSQQQVETLQKLSLSDTITDRAFADTTGEQSFSGRGAEELSPSAGVERMFPTMAPERSYSTAVAERPASEEAFAPAVPQRAETRRPRVAPWRRVIRWLQSPVRS